MECIFEALFQLVLEIVLEIIAEVVGAIAENVTSSDFWNFLTRHLPMPSLLSDEVITLDIQNYKGGNS